MFKKPDRLPFLGPLNIDNYDSFVKKSRTEFFSLWDLKWAEDASVEDFIKIKKLGCGSFGTVFLIKHENKGTFHAQKVIEKAQVVKSKQLEHTRNEMNIMKCINFPFTIYLEHFFKDNSYIHFVSPFVSGGELFYHLRRFGKFEENVAKFFGAQVVLSIEYLHSLDIVYRDLKPENLLLDKNGYLKLADFGFSRILKTRTYTLCGTPEYLAPEIVLNKGYGKSVDWWAIGVLLYELTAGKSPFYHNQAMAMYEKAAAGKFFIPNHFSTELRDLVRNILQPDLSRRYGNLFDGAGDVKGHKWFHNIEWLTLFNRGIKPPFIPKEISIDAGESCSFEKEFKIGPVDEFEKEFDNF